MLRILTFVLLVIAGFYAIFSWTVPEFKNIGVSKDNFDKATLSFVSAEKRKASFQEIDQFINTQKDDVTKVMNYFPNLEQEDKILHALSLAEEKSGVLISDFKIEKGSVNEVLPVAEVAPVTTTMGTSEVPAEPLIPNDLRNKYVEVTILGTGTYASAKNFLQSIQDVERNFEVKSVSIGKDTSLQKEKGDEALFKDIVAIDVTLRFMFAKESLAKDDTIFASFESRSSEDMKTFGEKQSIFPVEGLRDLDFQGGRENPFVSVR
ncbi:MAG: hypothetical protein IPN70_03265 [Candidatus Moraniibacteriota bacterium]|nr:MAG: hypothetical protein IPN70_03265 [Candidatus Moranbacteria bacterium]